MCNCSKRRSNLYAPPAHGVTRSTAYPTTHTEKGVLFEYTGRTALTVTGSITGQRYRFNHNGDVQIIDHRDASSMMGVPVLKKVNMSE